MLPSEHGRTMDAGERYDPRKDLLIEPLDRITIQGREVDTASPPAGFEARPDLGVLMHERLRPTRVHAWAPPHNLVFHPRAIVTPGGDYLLVCSAGRGHMWNGPQYDGKPNDLLMYRSSDKGTTWRGPFLPFKEPYGHNTSVFFVPRGGKRIYLFSTEVKPEWGGWPDGGIAMRHSDDDGWTWSGPRLIEPRNSPGYRGHAHIQMTETAAGTWLLGTYTVPAVTQHRRDRQYLLRSTDRGETWTLLPDKEPNGWFIPEFNYLIEGRPLALNQDEILFWGRAPGGHPYEFRSRDDGQTWQGPEPAGVKHPDAPPMIWPLADGKTLLALSHNKYDPKEPRHDHTARTELWFALSTDGARTWSEPRLLLANMAKKMPGPGGSVQVSYCGFLVDGNDFHLFVDWHNRQVLQFSCTTKDLGVFPTAGELSDAL